MLEEYVKEVLSIFNVYVSTREVDKKYEHLNFKKGMTLHSSIANEYLCVENDFNDRTVHIEIYVRDATGLAVQSNDNIMIKESGIYINSTLIASDEEFFEYMLVNNCNLYFSYMELVQIQKYYNEHCHNLENNLQIFYCEGDECLIK